MLFLNNCFKIINMKMKEIAKKNKVSLMFLSYLQRGLRFTTDINLAIDISKVMKVMPINLISPRLRQNYLKLKPSLNVKSK